MDQAWVQVAPSGRYFMTTDGRPFVPMGNQPGTGFMDFPDAEIEAHFARMEQYGETVARLDLDYFFPQSAQGDAEYIGLESSVGVFDLARAARIDRVFQMASAHGIRILVVPWLTSPPMWLSWSLNPYSTDRGGPATDPYEFMTSAEARSLFGSRLEWISARWGGQPTLFAWDLMNEADCLADWQGIDDPESLQSWVLELGSRMREFETAAHGRAHPRMVSWARSDPGETYAFLLTSAALDVASTHPYDLFGTKVRDYPDVRLSLVQPAIEMNERIRTLLTSRLTDRRPYLEDERHMNDQTMSRFHREAEHNMSWAELASGAAGAGITWLIAKDGDSKLDPAHLRERHEIFGPDRRALRDFVDLRVPAEFFLSQTTDEDLGAMSTSDASVVVMSVRRGKYAIGWLLGLDERCVQTNAVNEVREEIQLGQDPPAWETVLAILLWRHLLMGENVPVDNSQFTALLDAVRDQDTAAFVAALPGVLAYLEQLETTYGTLAALAACPPLSPSIHIGMPTGNYRVDWIDDGDASVLRSDPLPGGTGELRPPTFVRHMALVVRPE